jgi:nitrite reductase/ring-hydroxylating ferredoxin subunit
MKEGDVLRVMVRGTAVCLVKLQGGLRALEDNCPHQGRSFEGGTCEEGYLICPWHKMRFDPVTGRNKFGMTEAARVLPMEVRNDGVRIALPRKGLVIFGTRLW